MKKDRNVVVTYVKMLAWMPQNIIVIHRPVRVFWSQGELEMKSNAIK